MKETYAATENLESKTSSLATSEGSADTEIPRPSISFPYEINFPDSETSPATVTKIEEHLSKLERFYDRIMNCKVFVRIPHKHGGVRMFHVHIHLDVPGKRLAVGRDIEVDDSQLDIQLAIKTAFSKITRQLEDYVNWRKEHKPH